MNNKKLGIILAMGDSFEMMERTGQAKRFKKIYLKHFLARFNKVYVFSYKNENIPDLPNNIIVIANRFNFPRYVYAILMPFINFTLFREIDVFRVYHLYGCIPAIITKIFFHKPFIYNYAFDYEKDAAISKQWIQAFFYKFLKPLSIMLADKVYAANKEILKIIPESKGIYLPNGVDTNIFKPLKVKHNEFLILSVGRLESVKNYVNLIKALKGLKISLRLIGKGSLKEQLVTVAKANDVNLEIIEKVDNLQLPHYYNEANIFILPSINEGHPKALLEAMSCGVPVIASNVGGIKDIIVDNNNGLFCDVGIESIKNKILILKNNKALQKKLSKNSVYYIKENYDLSTLFMKETGALLDLT